MKSRQLHSQAEGRQDGAADAEAFEARVRTEVERRTAALPIMTHSTDRAGRLVAVSDAWLAKLGYRRPEALGRAAADFLTAESRERVSGFKGKFLRRKRIDNLTLQMTRRDGAVIDVLLSAVRAEDSQIGAVVHSIITDITEFAATRRLLHESEARYRFLAEHSRDLILLVGANGRRLYASPASRKVLGFEPHEAMAMTLAEAIHPEDAPRILPVLAANPADTMLTYRMRRKDGGFVWVETTGNTVEVAGGERHRLIIVRDIETRVAAERQMKASEARYRLLAENSSDMVFQLDSELACEYVSPAVNEILGYPAETMLGRKPTEGVHRDDAARLQLAIEALQRGGAERLSITLRMRRSDGRWIWLEAQIRALKSGGVIGALRDISARKSVEDELAEANARLRRLAGQDPLTGLANRRAFDEALAGAVERRGKGRLALIMIDVDRFKAFNDFHGHPAGDACLRRVAEAISGSLGANDLAARYGGEEFAVVSHVADEAEALAMAERIQKAVADLAIARSDCGSGKVTISVGLAVANPVARGVERLLLDADRALYAAKDNGRNAVVLASALPYRSAGGARR